MITESQAFEEATHILSGSVKNYFKIGARGFLYRYNGMEWVRSTASMRDLTLKRVSNPHSATRISR